MSENTQQKQAKAVEEGQNAKAAGRLESDNPYRAAKPFEEIEDPTLHAAWLFGFNGAKAPVASPTASPKLSAIASMLYKDTAVGASAWLIYGGASTDPGAREQFAGQIRELEAMEREGLVRITLRKEESQTGSRHVDRVRFDRLK